MFLEAVAFGVWPDIIEKPEARPTGAGRIGLRRSTQNQSRLLASSASSDRSPFSRLM
jgi:hypothetical protein